MDEFEQRLERQPLAVPPPDWRAEILERALSFDEPIGGVDSGRGESRSTLKSAIRGWLWPHPAAWGALAGVWLILILVQGRMTVEIQGEIAASLGESPPFDVMLALEQQRRIVEQLLAVNEFEPPPRDRPRPAVWRRPDATPLMLLGS